MCPPALTQSPIRLPLRKAGRAHIKLDGSRIIEIEGYPVSGIFLEMHVSTTAVSPRARARHLLLPPFNGPEVRRRGCSYAGVELPEHRQTQLLDRLILDGVREFGYVAEGHGSLRNWVLVLRGIVQINHIIVGVIRHKLQCLGNGNA